MTLMSLGIRQTNCLPDIIPDRDSTRWIRHKFVKMHALWQHRGSSTKGVDRKHVSRYKSLTHNGSQPCNTDMIWWLTRSLEGLNSERRSTDRGLRVAYSRYTDTDIICGCSLCNSEIPRCFHFKIRISWNCRLCKMSRI